jgi:hypothetical protein
MSTVHPKTQLLRRQNVLVGVLLRVAAERGDTCGWLAMAKYIAGEACSAHRDRLQKGSGWNLQSVRQCRGLAGRDAHGQLRKRGLQRHSDRIDSGHGRNERRNPKPRTTIMAGYLQRKKRPNSKKQHVLPRLRSSRRVGKQAGDGMVDGTRQKGKERIRSSQVTAIDEFTSHPACSIRWSLATQLGLAPETDSVTCLLFPIARCIRADHFPPTRPESPLTTEAPT